MKKEILANLNKLLSFWGFKILKVYEQKHLQGKYLELITEMENYYSEILKGYKRNPERNIMISKLYGTGVAEAMYLTHYLTNSLDLNGDVVEMGIANGATSALIASEIKNTNKSLWLFDSFMGLSKPTEKDKLIDDIFSLGSMEKYEGTMSYAVIEVKERLKQVNFPISRTKIIAGYIEKTISNKILPKKVCFAFIDFDLYEPIKTGLEFLDKVLVSGGYILVDDYGFFSTGAKKAVDEFLLETKSQYLFVKPKKFAGNFCILQKITQ